MCFQDISSMSHDASYFQVYIASIFWTFFGFAIVRKQAMQPVLSAKRLFFSSWPGRGVEPDYAKTSWERDTIRAPVR